MTANIRSMLEYEEGRRKKPYKCSEGHWTIGVGHKINDLDAATYSHIGGMTDEAMNSLLSKDIERATESAKKYLWFDKLNEARQAVIISMIFQMGAVGFAKFQNTIKMIAKGQYEAASENMLRSLWARQTPNRAKRHAEQFKTGVWCKEYKKLAA